MTKLTQTEHSESTVTPKTVLLSVSMAMCVDAFIVCELKCMSPKVVHLRATIVLVLHLV